MQLLFLVISVCTFLALYTHEKVLVTGGAGFIGSHVVQALLERQHAVVIVDNFHDAYDQCYKRYNLKCASQKHHEGCLTFYEQDICDLDGLRSLFEREKPTVICHTAAYAGVCSSVENASECITINVMGLLNILEMAALYGVRHLVLLSSRQVYGESDEGACKETSRADTPCSPYAASKRMGELLAYTYHHLYNVSCTCLRLFTVYGPRGRPNMEPIKFFDNLYKGTAISLASDIDAMRDYVYIDDVVDGVIRAIENPLGFEIINIGTGNPVSLRKLITTVEEVTHKKARIITSSATSMPQNRAVYADVTKAKLLLGYEPRVSLDDGIRRTHDWYENRFSCED